MGATTLWRDVPAAGDEIWLPVGGEKRPVAVVLGLQGERLDLRLSGPGFDGDDWFTVLADRGVQGVTTDDAPAYGPAAPGPPAWTGSSAPCTGSAPWGGTSAASTTTAHRDRVRLPILKRLARARPVLLHLWEAVMQGRVRLHPEVRALLRHLVEGWNDLVRSQWDPAVPASTNRPGAGLAASSPGPA
ncbi:MAG: hypothetical protein OXC13_12800 [Caldilineaceae bacterium]|nr:hypothetical protein [Caldilineaceae bacterium]